MIGSSHFNIFGWFAEKSARGAGTGPALPGYYEESCPKICHSGVKHPSFKATSTASQFKLSYDGNNDKTISILYQEQRKAENEGVTEDDVNEIKNDISAFR